MREVLVDANILLRYLTDEPRELADRAVSLLEAAEKQRVPLVVAPTTVAEVVYVLTSVYGWHRQRIIGQLLNLVTASVFAMIEREVIVQALILYRDFRALSFDDSYLAALAMSYHAGLISFDRDLRRVPDLKLIQNPEQIRRG